jgi:hypothetical protein
VELLGLDLPLPVPFSHMNKLPQFKCRMCGKESHNAYMSGIYRHIRGVHRYSNASIRRLKSCIIRHADNHAKLMEMSAKCFPARNRL